jgi:predicted CoA-substrate-specific enzyme activase
MLCGIDVGSTTCKYVLWSGGQVLAQAYERHDTRQAEKVLDFLTRLEKDHGLTPQRDQVFFTGSGAGEIAPLVGGRMVQEVVAVAAAVEACYPQVCFVSEIGGEDMKTVFFTPNPGAAATEPARKGKQVMMQAACSGGTGTFIEKTARKLQIASDQLATMGYDGYTLHRVSSKCGIFAEADANTLLKAGVSVEEIIASLFEAVVYQNLSSLTRGNTPAPEVLLLGGPNLFLKGLQQAWRHHLAKLWKERGVALPEGKTPADLIHVPEDALYFGALGCIEIGRREQSTAGIYQGKDKLRWWIEEGQHQHKRQEGSQGLAKGEQELSEFRGDYEGVGSTGPQRELRPGESVIVGCDFGSTTAKAVCLSLDREVLASFYTLSRGNPIEDAKALFGKIGEEISDEQVVAVSCTGYGKDLLKDIVGADTAVVETVAHASAGLHFFPDADCICDVGGMDVKLMLLANGAVSDFRLNSQCSSGNGAFLQGVAERFNIPLGDIADRAFAAGAMPKLSMGCGVFLQSDIVNQQRKGWQADEILAALCSILPLNVWVYAGGLTNLQQVGRKFILQGGTHRNLAVVKAQVDFIRSKIPDAEIVVHPYSGEAGALGAALVAANDAGKPGFKTRFRGFATIQQLNYKPTTSKDTVCKWCEVNCQRTFIDVQIEGAQGRPWSKVPLAAGWQRVIVNNSCPRGQIEDAREVKAVKDEIDRLKNEFPNSAQLVQKSAFRAARVEVE